ncbi:MAG: hypothetical protein AMXMBFR23_20460 [Chloroflexota bacterium]
MGRRRIPAWLIGSLVWLTVACGASDAAPVTATPAITPVATPSPSPDPTEEATEVVPVPDIRVTRLRIPSVGIDAPVGESQVVPNDAPPPPGCDPAPPGQTTLTVPPQGIVTPVDSFDGLEGRAWLFGHSRWQGEPGLLFALADLRAGDELVVDGVDRQTGEAVLDQRYVVEGIYLADRDSGRALVTGEAAAAPSVILQTSVRESGEGRPWIFDREALTASASNLVEGDLDDPCKYLLLFVVARAA